MLQVELEVLLAGGSAGLVSLLKREQLSVRILSHLDHQTTRDLRSGASSRVLLVLRTLQTLSRSPADLETLISRGLTGKLLHWFQVLRDLLTSDLWRGSAPILNIAEAFLNYFLLLATGPLPASHLSALLAQLTQFCQDPLVHFPLRLEAVRTINNLLEALDQEQRRSLRSGRSHHHTLCEMAKAVQTAGDYQLQVGLSEAVCRLTPGAERRLRANQLFRRCDISAAFCQITNQDFELDCRRFLNLLNSVDGDQRSVSSFPCLRVHLELTELLPPQDDQWDQWWVDFNLGSGCVSFFIADLEGPQWASVLLAREEATHCSLQHRRDGRCGPEVVLSVLLKTPIMHQGAQGRRVELTFDPRHQAAVMEAAGRVLGLTRRSPSPGRARPPPPAPQSRERVRVYRRSSRRSRRSRDTSRLKVLPLSSPSSEDDCGVARRNSTDFLFEHLCDAAPPRHSGSAGGAELDMTAAEPGRSSPVGTPPEVSEPMPDNSDPVWTDAHRQDPVGRRL